MILHERGLKKFMFCPSVQLFNCVYGGVKCIRDIREGKEHISVHIKSKSKSGMHTFQLLLVCLSSVAQSPYGCHVN